MAQGIFLHEYNTGGKLYDGSVSDAANRLANRQYVTDNAALQSNNLSDLDNASTARTNLGVAIGSDVQAYSARLGELSALSQSDGSFVVSDGSSFVFESGSTARSSLGLGSIATQDASSVSITGGSVAGITDLAIADGGTGASNAADARANLSAQESNARLDDIAGLTASDGGFIVGDGSNFVVESAATARASLNVDIAGTDNSTDVSLTSVSGNYLSLSGQEITASTVPVSLGGTGATTVAAAQQALDLEPGVDIQEYDAELAAIASLTSAANKIPMFSGSGSATLVDFLDEDGMDSDSATGIPSQQSVKAFVQAQVQGLDVKNSVRVATTANLSATYSSSAKTLTMSSTGVLTIDGGNIAQGDRVLVKDQSTGTQNGVYECTTAGATGSATGPGSSLLSSASSSWDTGNSYTLNASAFASYTGGTFNGLSSQIYFTYSSNTYQGSTVSVAAGSAVLFSDGTDTFAMRMGGTLTNGQTGQSLTAQNAYPYIAELSTVTSITPNTVTSVTVYPRNYASLVELLDDYPNAGIDHTDTSFFIQQGGWGGSTISAGDGYVRYEPVDGQVYYWEIDADLDNGDTSLSVSYDATNSYATTISAFNLPLSDSNQSRLTIVGTNAGSNAAAAVLTRASDFDEDSEVTAGAFTFVEEGTINDNAGFVLSTDEPFAIDTDSITFTQFSGAGQITAGTGLSKSGNTINASGTLADIAGLAVTDGGIIVGDGSNFVLETGSTARASLDAQQSNARLDDISALAVTDGGIIVGDGSNFVLESGATARASLDAQQRNDILDDLAGLTQAADKGMYFDSSSTAATFDLTAAGRALLDDADASAQRSTLGLGSIATQASSSVSISGGSISGINDLAVADGGTGASSASDARTNLGVAIGSDVQSHSDILDDIAGVTQAADKAVYFDSSSTAATFDLTSAARALLDDADAAAMRATLGLVIGTDVAPADSSEMSVDTSEPSSLAVDDVSGMYVYDLSSASTSATVSLPSTATSGAAGKSVIFKIKGAVGSGSSLTISPASNQTIEGESSIVLNQERQSIRLVISEEYSSGSSVQCWVAV